MKVVNLKQAILQAWKERWSDYQWAINMKRFFPRGATWDILNLAEALLEQAMIGPSPNPLILSYLKYAISSQMVSYSTVLMAISKFDDFSRDLCVQSLLEIMDMFCDRLSCHGKIKFPSTGMDTIPYWNLLPPKKPIKEVLTSVFTKVLEKGWVDSRSIHIFDTLLHMGGVYWFCNNLVKELLKETRKEHTLRAVELLYAIFCLDMHQLTLTLLGHILPNLLTDSSKWHTLMDPPGKALAKLSVWCALSSYSSHSKVQASARQKKRHREDIEDYISLFPLDDTQPSKLMRLLSSNEEDSNILSSPNRSMSSSLSASQLHTVSMRDPLNRVLANLFLLISSILGAKTAGTHTQFVQWFMEECVECLEQGSRGSILQFMPFTMVSELVKVSTMSSPKIVLAITDLSLPLGRRVAAKAIAAL
uniref:Mediator of RNA polymerase II transcription subunit 24 n=1 Tax=Geospiza parvula TaxID=87175 RepID=A0A8U8BEJ4_GEOPR